MRHVSLIAALLVACSILPAAVRADDPAPAAAPPASAAPAPAADAPIPVPVPSDTAMQYYRTGNLWWLGTTWGLLIPIVLLWSGLSARMRDLARRIGKNWFFTVAIYGVLFVVLTTVIDLPFDWLQSFVRPHAYGLSSQTAAKWWHDQAIGFALGVGFIACGLWFPYLLLRKSPRRWWLYTGLAAIPLIVVILFVTPIWIEPLFNKFGPMKDKALESQILALANRAGIEGSRVYEVEKSVDTNTVNAYVTGFLDTKRIVLWDTILAKLGSRESAGWSQMYHVPSTYRVIAVASLLILMGLWIVHAAAGGLIARNRERFGFSELSDVASLPLVMLLFSLVGLVLTPAVNAFSRHTEHEADRFGLEITRDNHACASAFVKLQKENLSNPRPGLLVKLWRADHPPLGERIDFCNEYKPWAEGKALKYGDKMRPGA